MNTTQATEIIREIESLCREHGLWYTKVIEHKGNTTVVRLQEISVKMEKRPAEQ